MDEGWMDDVVVLYCRSPIGAHKWLFDSQVLISYTSQNALCEPAVSWPQFERGPAPPTSLYFYLLCDVSVGLLNVVMGRGHKCLILREGHQNLTCPVDVKMDAEGEDPSTLEPSEGERLSAGIRVSEHHGGRLFCLNVLHLISGGDADDDLVLLYLPLLFPTDTVKPSTAHSQSPTSSGSFHQSNCLRYNSKLMFGSIGI